MREQVSNWFLKLSEPAKTWWLSLVYALYLKMHRHISVRLSWLLAAGPCKAWWLPQDGSPPFLRTFLAGRHQNTPSSDDPQAILQTVPTDILQPLQHMSFVCFGQPNKYWRVWELWWEFSFCLSRMMHFSWTNFIVLPTITGWYVTVNMKCGKHIIEPSSDKRPQQHQYLAYSL